MAFSWVEYLAIQDKMKLIKATHGAGLLLLALLSAGCRHFPRAAAAEPAPRGAIPTLDELAGDWQNAAEVRSLPALNGSQGSAQAARDVLAVGNLSFPPITMSGVTGTLRINGKRPELKQTRWYPYQVLRKGADDDVGIETATRMVYGAKGLLFHIVLTNHGSALRTFDMTIGLSAATSMHKHWGWKIPRPKDARQFRAVAMDNGRSLLLRDADGALANCFSFERKPDGLTAGEHTGRAAWRIRLQAHASETVNYAVSFGERAADVHELAVKWAAHFAAAFGQVETDWQERFAAMFTPGNAFFSGHLPVLITPDREMRRVYYVSAISLLSVLRTGFPVAPRVYVSNTPESNCTMMYFWDTREWATTLALLDPVMLKQYLRAWLSKGIHNGYAEEYLTGSLRGVWYSANDYSVFILLNDYLNVTGDRAFLSERINGRTVLEHMDAIATHWQQLVRPGQVLADYGGASNLLECVPTYINEVASFNAANVWMMRRVAAIQAAEGNRKRAAELRAAAGRLLRAVLGLYVPGQGVWDAIHRDGARVQIRHVFDFATIGLTIPGDLTPAMRRQMTSFVERELMTDHWMRAQSLSDPAASVSDRPDHGPMGAYCAWPAETMAALCEFGEFGRALDFLHRCSRVTWEGPFSQSRELMTRKRNAPVRIAERGGGGLPSQTYNASNGGSFAETIIREFFGYQPDFLNGTRVPDSRPRGFEGRLLNVREDGREFDIDSTAKGLAIPPASEVTEHRGMTKPH